MGCLGGEGWGVKVGERPRDGKGIRVKRWFNGWFTALQSVYEMVLLFPDLAAQCNGSVSVTRMLGFALLPLPYAHLLVHPLSFGWLQSRPNTVKGHEDKCRKR